tara:strand:+ start:97 stop:774 length:678 start_codon:yes stop_codon:yes gene_type:complete
MDNFIEIYEDALTNESCNFIIDSFEKYKDKTHAGSTGSVGRVNTKVKDSTDLDLMIIKHLLPEVLLNELKTSLKSNVSDYSSKYKFMDPKYEEEDGKDIWNYYSFNPTSILAKKYKKGEQGYHVFHADWGLGKLTALRQLICMYYLNDVKEGGETEFLNQKLKIKPKKGSLVVFPAFWTHLHKGHIPISDDKYILNFWLLRGLSRNPNGFSVNPPKPVEKDFYID